MGFISIYYLLLNKKMSRNLTIENLNSAYVSLIKMVLNGSSPIESPYIKSFYHDPSPAEAY